MANQSQIESAEALHNLKLMLDEHLITQEEYDAQKAKLMNNLKTAKSAPDKANTMDKITRLTPKVVVAIASLIVLGTVIWALATSSAIINQLLDMSDAFIKNME